MNLGVARLAADDAELALQRTLRSLPSEHGTWPVAWYAVPFTLASLAGAVPSAPACAALPVMPTVSV